MKCVCLERNVLTGALTYGRADRAYLLSSPSNKRGLLTIGRVFNRFFYFFFFFFFFPNLHFLFFLSQRFSATLRRSYVEYSNYGIRRCTGRKCSFADFALSTLPTDRRYGLSGGMPKHSSTIFLVFTRLAERKLLQLLRNGT